MNKIIEKKIEKEMGKKVAMAVKKEVDKEVEERVEEVEKAVMNEVEKRLHMRLYEGAKDSAVRFKGEFKKQVVVAISAALGFLIALSWRTPLQNSVSLMIEKMGMSGGAVYFEFLSAILITLFGVLGLMWLSKWSVGGS